ncbi:MAG: heme o synthase [Candidatus Sericytochromatia bacterium]|nr:heme o synthase [Candidatus Sericytochromatia bacterium]
MSTLSQDVPEDGRLDAAAVVRPSPRPAGAAGMAAPPSGEAAAPGSLGDVVRAYLTLTKPTILLTVLATGLPALLLAARDRPSDPGLVLATLGGTALASAGAAAINHYMDRDIDAVMYRTRGRPLPTGTLGPRKALAFGVLLSFLSTAILAWKTTWLATVIAVASILYYTVFYTGWLKRRTPQNIVIGGAAGASAPLICWSAVTGDMAWAPVLMFLIVFLWTPPHFWALALFRKDDYAQAGVPMLPVVAGEDVTKRQIVGYSVVMILSSFALPWWGAGGTAYLVAASVLGAGFLWLAAQLYREASVKRCMRLFTYSIAYLLLLFGALAVDIATQRPDGPAEVANLSLMPPAEAAVPRRAVRLKWIGVSERDVPATIRPAKPTSELRLGTKGRISFQITNHSSQSLTFEAIPHVAPAVADAHFHKVVCFCHRVQTLGPGQSRNFELVYTIDLDLPTSVGAVTLSYTLTKAHGKGSHDADHSGKGPHHH